MYTYIIIYALILLCNCSQVDQNYASPVAPISTPENSMVNNPLVIDTAWYHSR
jgi:hypothetical protein